MITCLEFQRNTVVSGSASSVLIFVCRGPVRSHGAERVPVPNPSRLLFLAFCNLNAEPEMGIATLISQGPGHILALLFATNEAACQ